jgi:hypothetical protein
MRFSSICHSDIFRCHPQIRRIIAALDLAALRPKLERWNQAMRRAFFLLLFSLHIAAVSNLFAQTVTATYPAFQSSQRRTPVRVNWVTQSL